MLQDCSEPDDSQWAKDGGNVNQYFWYLIQFCPAALWQIIVFPRLDLVNLDLVLILANQIAQISEISFGN